MDFCRRFSLSEAAALIPRYSLIYGFALFLSFLGYNFYGWLSDNTGTKGF